MIKGQSWLAARRWIDGGIALIALIFLGPLIVLVSALIFASDRSFPFVRLDRTGHRRSLLRLTKLRTMSSDAHRTSGITAGKHDPRITPIGRQLRRYRLDEVPQLVDVVTGRMSIIGPRPEDSRYVDDSALWDIALSVRPGIAGLTQILAGPWEATNLSGSDATDRYVAEALQPKLALDAWYAENASPRVDWIVIRSLALQFLRGSSHTPAHDIALVNVPESRVFLQAARL